MRREIFKFKFGDMPVSVRMSAFIGTDILIVILVIAAIFLTDLSPLDSVIVGILGAILYWLTELIHMYGHFFAAKRVGYPAQGIALWWVLGTILYPKDEPELAPDIHIQRALGGPIANLIQSIVVAILLYFWLWNMGGAGRFLGTWFLIASFGIFTIGSLFPPMRIGSLETDGATILRYLQAKNKQGA